MDDGLLSENPPKEQIELFFGFANVSAEQFALLAEILFDSIAPNLVGAFK